MTWKFDAAVAKTFVDHARQHIPNYDQVIEKSVDLCRHFVSADSKIIDVGCATGQTIRRLHDAGFNNLHGVDASDDMLQYCDQEIAQYYHTTVFPDQKFDVVICNWTLHFIKDKINYLTDIHRGLNDQGLFVLSEKTSLDPTSIDFYHQWKHSQGVSWTEIHSKEQAVKDVMFVNDVSWYLDTLARLGFKNTQVIDASWCFTSFVCFK